MAAYFANILEKRVSGHFSFRSLVTLLVFHRFIHLKPSTLQSYYSYLNKFQQLSYFLLLLRNAFCYETDYTIYTIIGKSVDHPSLVREVAKMHEKLTDTVEIINKCYALQVKEIYFNI